MALFNSNKFKCMLNGVTSNHNGDHYCLNCFHWYRAKEALKKTHE